MVTYTVFRVRRDKAEVGHQSVEKFFGLFYFLVRQPEVRHQSVTLKSPYKMDFRENPLWFVFFNFSEASKKTHPLGLLESSRFRFSFRCIIVVQPMKTGY